MDVRSIYYTSSSFDSKYPQNTRSLFENQIDEQEFHYINKKNVNIGLKHITFENTYNTFKTNYGCPNMIIVQDNYKQIIDPVYDRVHVGPESPEINIKSGFDYYILSDKSPSYLIGKTEVPRSFTDVKLSCFFPDYPDPSLEGPIFQVQRFMVHNIYFHEIPLESEIELITYLNYIYLNVEFDLSCQVQSRQDIFRLDRETKTLFEVDKNGLTSFWDKRHLGLDIFLSSELCQILGFTQEKLYEDQSNSLQQLLFENFRNKTLPSVRGEDELVYRPLYKAENLQEFTRDTNIQYILNHNWNEHRYLRIPQKDRPVTDSVYLNKFTSTKKIHMEHGKPVLLGLRTSLSKPDIFTNCQYDTQLEFMNVKDMAGGIQTFEVAHPSLHNTSIEKISNAKFELIDIDTGARPNFSAGTPTFLHFHVSEESIMSTRFNLFLDSSDSLSQTYFPTNTSADFRVKFPERLEFNKTWEITLKNIFIGNDLFNIYSRSCWFSCEIITRYTQDVNIMTKIFLEDGLYKTSKELCEHIQSLLVREKCPLKISLRNKINRVKITYEGRPLVTLREFQDTYAKLRFTMSPMLANILGFSRSIDDDFKLYWTNKKTYTSTFSSKINLLIPRNFMILCDVVSESVFGSSSIKILKLLSSNFQPGREMIKFDFHQDEFVELAIKEFASLRIIIADTTGNTIKSVSTYPTRCQIQFQKKNK